MGHAFKLSSPVSLQQGEGSKMIIDLSKKICLNSIEISLLKKGLSFISTWNTTKNYKKRLELHLQNYHRRLKLEAYFENKKTKPQLPFTPKSDWTPSLSQLPPAVRKIIRADNYAFRHLHWGNKLTHNLDKNEIKALQQLQKNKHIVIKLADKGNIVVIMDREQYIWEGLRQLNNTHHYIKLTKPIYTETITLVKTILENLTQEGYINKKQKQYLLGNDIPRARRFYLLPKVHKDPANWSKSGEIPPGRPIVSDCDSETYFISEFIEYYLNPLSNRHPSYLKDSYDFIDKVEQLKIPPSAFLFTIDIDSLYTNIETDLGLL